jgi:PAS domain S-box-containing protein
VQLLPDFPMDAEVVRSQQPLVISDTYKEPRWVVQPETSWVRSHIVAPIVLSNRVLGLLRLDSRTPGAFSAEAVARLMPLVNAAAIALENARLYEHAKQELAERKRAEEALQNSLHQLNAAYNQSTSIAQELKKEVAERKQAEGELRQRNRELALLNRVISASAANQEPEKILDTVCRELALAFEVPHAVALMVNADRSEATVAAEFYAAAGEDGESSAGRSVLQQTLPLTNSPAAQAMFSTTAPFTSPDAQADPRVQILCQLLEQFKGCSLLILPLIIDKEVAGCLVLNAAQRRNFVRAEVNLGRRVAEQISGVLARSRLAQTRLRLITAIEQAAESVVITEIDGVIGYVNPAFERITGYSPADAQSQNMETLLKIPGQDEAVYQEMWATVRAGRVWHGRFKNKRKDGSVYTEDATISPVRSKGGKIVNFVAVMRDVSRELLLEEQYLQAQKMEAIGLLAGGIAHDFNNLLTAINGFAEMLQLELPAHEQTLHQLAANIRHTGKRATSLVRQLLTFSRKQVVEAKTLNLNDVVLGLENMLKRIIGEHIEVETDLCRGLWPVKTDPNQIEQVIVNLVVNAHDAMPHGGRLSIKTANEMLDEEAVADHLGVEPGPYVMLSITDTGAGMSKEVLTHIFDPFFTTKEYGKGTGLGLSTVFGIVKQSSGDIWVYSEEGQGTTFKIYLPRTRRVTTPLPSREMRREQQTTLPGGHETVLLVEDEPAVRALAIRILHRQGYKVLEATNGEEALQVVQQHAGVIDLLLTDTVMPRMGGEALVEQFKKIRPNTKILFTSGYSDRRSRLQAPNAAYAFIQKPFSAVGLAQKVRAVLDGTE